MITGFSRKDWFTIGLLAVALQPTFAGDLPAHALLKLSSEEFCVREEGQSELLTWGRLCPDIGKNKLFDQMKVSHDPEIRVRCMSVLRQLVIDDYLKEGDGYIGIALLGEMTKIPQDPKPRGVIRITQVQPNSPASRAAILVGDRIIGLDREIWYEADMYIKFQNRIKATKPDTRVTLHILRENVILDVLMTLVRRPVAIDNSLFFSRRGSDLDGLEAAAKEGYFRQWLENKN